MKRRIWKGWWWVWVRQSLALWTNIKHITYHYNLCTLPIVMLKQYHSPTIHPSYLAISMLTCYLHTFVCTTHHVSNSITLSINDSTCTKQKTPRFFVRRLGRTTPRICFNMSTCLRRELSILYLFAATR